MWQSPKQLCWHVIGLAGLLLPAGCNDAPRQAAANLTLTATPLTVMASLGYDQPALPALRPPFLAALPRRDILTAAYRPADDFGAVKDYPFILSVHFASENMQAAEKYVTLLKRRPDLTLDAFRAYLYQQHAPLALRLPGLVEYRLSVVEQDDPTAPYDAVAEHWFSTPAAAAAAGASPEGQAATQDIAAHCATRIYLTLREQRLL